MSDGHAESDPGRGKELPIARKKVIGGVSVAGDFWEEPRTRYNHPFGESGCESGGIGRRTGFRFQRGSPWGFESPLSHQALALMRPEGLRRRRAASLGL